jgi:hypothetical protein
MAGIAAPPLIPGQRRVIQRLVSRTKVTLDLDQGAQSFDELIVLFLPAHSASEVCCRHASQQPAKKKRSHPK